MTEGIDRAKFVAMRRDLDSDGLVRDLIGIFFEEIPKHLEATREAIEAGDAEEARHAAHTMKSTAGQLCAARLRELAVEMEGHARDGEMDEVADKLPEAEACFEAARSDLEELRETLG